MAAPYEQREKPHIEKRRRKLYAVLAVPVDVQRKLGKKRLTMTLRTDSPAVAEKRAAPIIARWRRQIEKARGSAVETDLEFYRRILSPEEIATIRVIEVDEETGLPVGADPITHEAHLTTIATAQRFIGERFDKLLDEWQAGETTTQKTKDMQAADVKRFATKFRTVASIDKASVKRWTSGTRRR